MAWSGWCQPDLLQPIKVCDPFVLQFAFNKSESRHHPLPLSNTIAPDRLSLRAASESGQSGGGGTEDDSVGPVTPSACGPATPIPHNNTPIPIAHELVSFDGPRRRRVGRPNALYHRRPSNLPHYHPRPSSSRAKGRNGKSHVSRMYRSWDG